MGDLLPFRRVAAVLPAVTTRGDRVERDRATADALRSYLRAGSAPERPRVDVRL